MRLPPVTATEESQGMSAMTDVVFLLLIFFIVTMSGYVEMTLLEINPPAASEDSARVDLRNSLKIELAAHGEYLINGAGYSPEALRRLLSRYARLMPDAEFLLQCHPESRHHMLVALLDALAGHRLKNVKLLKP